MFSGQVRPRTGAPCLFPCHMEEDIALYMKHCQFLHIPRTRQLLRDDILHFVQYKQLNIPRMADEGPGKHLLHMSYSYLFTFLGIQGHNDKFS